MCFAVRMYIVMLPSCIKHAVTFDAKLSRLPKLHLCNLAMAITKTEILPMVYLDPDAQLHISMDVGIYRKQHPGHPMLL